MDIKKLQKEQLEKKIKIYSAVKSTPIPSTGWIRAIRMALGMTLQQLAKKLSITRQSVRELEVREKEGAVTLATLRDVARAMDMELVYGIVPKDGTLDEYIDKKARELAEKVVYRTSATMKLEDQQNTDERIEQAIKERTESIKKDLPKALWD